MTAPQPIRSAILSVYDKTGLIPFARELAAAGVQLHASGGTAQALTEAGLQVTRVEELTGYPAILGGRVKTLHPAVFGGILAIRDDENHQQDLKEHNLPVFDLVVVDLYPFEASLREGAPEEAMIEKIDIGGIALIRAAAKNYNDVAVVCRQPQFRQLRAYFEENEAAATTAQQRRQLALEAFRHTARYDQLISQWLGEERLTPLRYGENPHQEAHFSGNLQEVFQQHSGKPLSYNNLIDIEGALRLIRDFEPGTVGIFKHTNPCGLATRPTLPEAWEAALACDPVSAFGGIIISNLPLDLATAEAINDHFYEVLLAPEYTPEALELLQQKPKRILLEYNSHELPQQRSQSLLTGTLSQTADLHLTPREDMQLKTGHTPSAAQWQDVHFGEAAVKHLKSNAIGIVRNQQLIGAGVGQTSRIDALEQAIGKAEKFSFGTEGAVLVSDGFFPFADSVEHAHRAGIRVVVQPGGSVRDQDIIDFCEANGMSLIFTGIRHFRH